MSNNKFVDLDVVCIDIGIVWDLIVIYFMYLLYILIIWNFLINGKFV